MRGSQKLPPIVPDGTGGCRFHTSHTGRESRLPREIGPFNYIRKELGARPFRLPVFHIPHQESDATRLQYASDFLHPFIVVGVAPMPSLTVHKVRFRRERYSHLSDEDSIGPATLLTSREKCPLTQRDRNRGLLNFRKERLTHPL
jgi:hypothetical protein